MMKKSADEGVHSNNDTRQFDYWESDDEVDETMGGMFPDMSEFEPGCSCLDIAYKKSTPAVIEVVEKAYVDQGVCHIMEEYGMDDNHENRLEAMQIMKQSGVSGSNVKGQHADLVDKVYAKWGTNTTVRSSDPDP